MKGEFSTKITRLREYLLEQGYGAVLLAGNENFSWLTCGHSGYVDKGTGEAAAKLLVTPERQYALCNSSEMFRIPEEELVDSDFEVVSYRWHEDVLPVLEGLTGGCKVVCDRALYGYDCCGEDLTALRAPLTEAEVQRYREIGPLVADIVESCCREIRPGDTELEIAGRVTGDLMAVGCLVPVCLVSADERILQYRHPIPTGNRVKKRAQVAVCAQKYSLTVSMTRIVSFEALDGETARRFDAVTDIDAGYILDTAPGEKAGDIVAAAHRQYDRWGYEEEFHLHHQGGALGYLTRDYCANEGTAHLVGECQAFSWNPTIRGVKSEDTFLVAGGTQELISLTGNWPSREIVREGQRIRRPEILIQA